MKLGRNIKSRMKLGDAERERGLKLAKQTLNGKTQLSISPAPLLRHSETLTLTQRNPNSIQTKPAPNSSSSSSFQILPNSPTCFTSRFIKLGKLSMELQCVQCGKPMEKLYVQYSPGNIRLLKCSNCKSFADEYIECEFMIILIDLILHKPKAYRHLLFNTHNHKTINPDTFLLKTSAFFLLLDAFKFSITAGTNPQPGLSSFKFYLNVFLCTILGNLAFVCFLMILSRRFLRFVDGYSGHKEFLLAVVVSSYLKLFMVAMAIWEFPSSVAYIIDLIVMSSNLLALDVITKSSYRRCLGVCFGSHGIKLLVIWMLKLLMNNYPDTYLL